MITETAPRKGIGCGMTLLILIGGLAFLAFIGSHVGEKTPASPGSAPAPTTGGTVQIGQKGHLHASGGPVWLAVSAQAEDARIKASIANDTVGLQNLIMAGQLFSVEDGTAALVIDRSGLGVRQVRILEGPAKDRAGYLPMEWVVP